MIFFLATLALSVLFLIVGWQELYGYSMSAIPFVICFTLGWYFHFKRGFLLALSALIVFSAISGIVLTGVSGLLCGGIVAIVVVLPALAGALLGHWLELLLRRRHGTSPTIVPLILFFAVGAALPIEKRLTPVFEPESISTREVLSLDAETAWNRILFYEQVPFEPPALARIGIPHPLRTEGSVDGVGDVKRCVYTTGYLRKRISRFQPGEELAFDVIEQVHIEDRSAELISGSFRFEAIGDERTAVTLTTTYRPLLGARLIWRPFERAVVRVLHRHVLDGMRRSDATAEPVRMAQSDR